MTEDDDDYDTVDVKKDQSQATSTSKCSTVQHLTLHSHAMEVK